LEKDSHREIERSMRKRPWHAVEGAVSIVPILAAELDNDNLLCAAFAAVARHHSPYSDAHQPYRLVKNAHQHIRNTFPHHIQAPDLQDLITSAERENPQELIPNPDGEVAAFLAYLLIARALRRADVAGTKAGNLR
jgi:hypothetical protein